VTDRIDGLNKIAIRGAAPDVAIHVAGSADAGSSLLESSVELATINVVPGYSYAGPGIWRVPLEDDAMRSSAGYRPEEHHTDDPQ
jgi:hypothetical protein